MNLFAGFEEWDRKRRQKEDTPEGIKKFALTNNAPPSSKPFKWPAGELAITAPKAAVRSTDDRRDDALARRGNIPKGTIPNNTMPQMPREKSVLEILMDRLNEEYEGPDPSQMDFSALDRALQGRLGQLTAARDQIRGNFDTSDKNLEGMHRAFENQVRTDDAARYNQISDQLKSNLTGNMNQGVGNLEAARAKAVAERQAMLQNLGIQAAGAAPDPGAEALNQGINTMTSRNNINQNLADQQRATNLSYNNTVAQSIGQAGVQRRAALQNQLQGLLGKVAMAEAEAKAQNEVERQRSIGTQSDYAYKRWNDRQNRTQDLFDTLAGIESRERIAGMGGEGSRPQGMNSIAEQLAMSGIDPSEASNAVGILGRVLGGGNFLHNANRDSEGNEQPYDTTAVLAQKLQNEGLDPMTASQVAMLYGVSRR
jgi:hypothetical protein